METVIQGSTLQTLRPMREELGEPIMDTITPSKAEQ